MVAVPAGIDAALLTGGASRRMGSDKAAMPVDGEPLAERIARMLLARGHTVTVLGPRAIDGCAHLPDDREHPGPAASLARLEPSGRAVFVAACDMPAFDPRIVEVLEHAIGDRDAAAPVVDGRAQPLCALYRPAALHRLRALTASGEQRIMRWFGALEAVAVDEAALAAGGLWPGCVLGANTPAELARLLDAARTGAWPIPGGTDR